MSEVKLKRNTNARCPVVGTRLLPGQGVPSVSLSW